MVIILTKIYIVRHCEALGNVQKLFQGITDLDITENGKSQLEYLTKRFESIELDSVYSSPLIRTQKTAKAIIGKKDMNFIINRGLIEINAGIIEGKPFLESCAKYPQLAETWSNHPEDFAPENGDTMREVYDRIWNAVKNITIENKGKTVACASHGGAIRCLLCKILHDDITKLITVPISGNTAVTLIEFDDQLNPSVKFMNDISHLPEEHRNNMAPIISSVKGVKE